MRPKHLLMKITRRWTSQQPRGARLEEVLHIEFLAMRFVRVLLPELLESRLELLDYLFIGGLTRQEKIQHAHSASSEQCHEVIFWMKLLDQRHTRMLALRYLRHMREVLHES